MQLPDFLLRDEHGYIHLAGHRIGLHHVVRLMRAGAKLWQSPRIRSWYYPRASLRALFNQYAQYGYWKVRVIQKHKLPASIRHLVPGSFVASLMILIQLSCFSHTARWLLVPSQVRPIAHVQRRGFA